MNRKYTTRFTVVTTDPTLRNVAKFIVVLYLLSTTSSIIMLEEAPKRVSLAAIVENIVREIQASTSPLLYPRKLIYSVNSFTKGTLLSS